MPSSLAEVMSEISETGIARLQNGASIRTSGVGPSGTSTVIRAPRLTKRFPRTVTLMRPRSGMMRFRHQGGGQQLTRPNFSS